MAATELRASVTERLLELLDRPILAADRRRAALHVVDWVACAMIGRGTQPGRIFETEAGNGTVPMFAGLSADAATAAFVLGGFGSIYEMDDVHRTALLHPGPVVIPAVLAAATAEASGEDTLDAVIVGYEAMIRLGCAVGSGHYAFYHNTGTCGGFGAAAATSRLLRLTRAQASSALGNAMSATGGLWQCRHENVMTKPYHCAEAARRGVIAARLASRGLTGPRFIVEGPQGFFAAACPNASPQDVLDAPKDEWRIHQTSFKPWPACRHAHAAIDAALRLRDATASSAIRRVVIQTYRDAQIFCDRMHPTTTTEAKFSLQHAVAVALIDGAPPLAAFDPPTLDRPDLVALRSRSEVVAAEVFTHAYPRHFGSSVTIELDDGSSRTEQVHDAWGDSENPVAEADLVAKSRTLLEAAGVATGARDRVLGAALALADGGNLAEFRAAFHAA